MTTAVYTIRPRCPDHASLVCHLRSITPAEAIAKLDRAGVLAIPGPDESSILLLGYQAVIRDLLDDFKRFGHPHRPTSLYLMGKLAKLSMA